MPIINARCEEILKAAILKGKNLLNFKFLTAGTGGALRGQLRTRFSKYCGVCGLKSLLSHKITLIIVSGNIQNSALD